MCLGRCDDHGVNPHARTEAHIDSIVVDYEHHIGRREQGLDSSRDHRLDRHRETPCTAGCAQAPAGRLATRVSGRATNVNRRTNTARMCDSSCSHWHGDQDCPAASRWPRSALLVARLVDDG